jgi:CDP-6-deoxy-D-xylo-4-hexulose-3-dehydrase
MKIKRVLYGQAVYGNKEIQASVNVLKKNSYNLIDGPAVKKLEHKIAYTFGKKYGLMVNSGSSANLLAIASLDLKKGTEIITPTLTFSTTIAPIYQLGYKAHFVDVGHNDFIANTKQIEESVTKNTSAIMIPNLLGNIADWKKIYKIAKKHNLKIIEDSADTVGYSSNGKKLGSFSDVTTNSMYASHIITGAGFGGMLCFNDYKLYLKAKLLRGWGRSSATFNESEGIKLRFNTKVDGIPYDGKYIFSALGYNFLPSEISAAFALEQLKNLNQNIKIRINNFRYLKNFFSKHNNFFELPNETKSTRTGWLAYPLILKDKIPFDRKNLQIYLEKQGIQTRTIFTGNILRQPIMKGLIYKKHRSAEFNANKIMRNGILLGCHHGLRKDHLEYMILKINNFLRKFTD